MNFNTNNGMTMNKQPSSIYQQKRNSAANNVSGGGVGSCDVGFTFVDEVVWEGGSKGER